MLLDIATMEKDLLYTIDITLLFIEKNYIWLGV